MDKMDANSKLNTLETRVDALESRLAFQEDTLTTLNDRIAQQDQELAKLQFQLKHLNQKVQRQDESQVGPANAADERPPHY